MSHSKTIFTLSCLFVVTSLSYGLVYWEEDWDTYGGPPPLAMHPDPNCVVGLEWFNLARYPNATVIAPNFILGAAHWTTPSWFIGKEIKRIGENTYDNEYFVVDARWGVNDIAIFKVKKVKPSAIPLPDEYNVVNDPNEYMEDADFSNWIDISPLDYKQVEQEVYFAGFGPQRSYDGTNSISDDPWNNFPIEINAGTLHYGYNYYREGYSLCFSPKEDANDFRCGLDSGDSGTGVLVYDGNMWFLCGHLTGTVKTFPDMENFKLWFLMANHTESIDWIYEKVVEMGGGSRPMICFNLTQDKAYRSIQSAIDDAIDGDTIELLPICYSGEGSYNLDLGGKSITVQSLNPDDPNVVAATIIDCGGTRNNPNRAFIFDSGEEPNSVVSGITIKNGYGLLSEGYYAGSAIFCSNSSPTISKCVFKNNGALEQNVDGGAIACYNNANPIISHCIFEDNAAEFSGAISCWASSPEITNCLFFDNSADWGEVIYFYEAADATIVNCTMTQNISPDGDYVLFVNGSDPVFINNIIWNNSVGLGSPTGIVCYEGAQPVFKYCDIMNSNGSGVSWPTSIGVDGGGNIDVDPNFVNTSINDYRLENYSSCLEVGDPNTVYCEYDLDGTSRFRGNRTDMGTYEFSGVFNVNDVKWFYTIQAAIDDPNISTGDELTVYPGVYTEFVNFNGKSVTVSSSNPADKEVVAQTVIAAPNSNNDTACVKFILGETSASILNGLTIKDAYYGVQCGAQEGADCSPIIQNCDIENSIYGIYIRESSPIIINNHIKGSPALMYGIYGDNYKTPTINNNIIYDFNRPNLMGTGIELEYPQSSTMLYNNTIVNCNYGISLLQDSIPQVCKIYNSIVWDISDDEWSYPLSSWELDGGGNWILLTDTLDAYYSCIQDCNAINGNINTDPNFVDAANDDYHLSSTSPCIDTGDPNGIYVNQIDVDNEPRVLMGSVDIGADELGLPANHPDYQEWVNVGFPSCWLQSRQCYGDANGQQEVIARQMRWVGYDDIDILLDGFNKTYSGDPAVDTWIAADFNHKAEKIGPSFRRVGYDDINILLDYFNTPDVPCDCQQ